MFMFIRSKPLQIQHSPVKLHSVLNAITARWATACPLWTAFSDFKFLNGIEFTTALCLLLQNYLIFFVIHSWNSSTLSVFFLFPTISHTLCYFPSSICGWDQQTLPWNDYFKVFILSDIFSLCFLVLPSYVLTYLYPDFLTKQNGRNPQQTPEINKKETKTNGTKES